MIEMKTVDIEASMPDERNSVTGRYVRRYSFRMISYPNGEKWYFLNDKRTDRDSGNDRYREIMSNGKDIHKEVRVRRYDFDGLIKYYMSGYDQYAEYIDSPKVYSSVMRSNERILGIVNGIKSVRKSVEGA